MTKFHEALLGALDSIAGEIGELSEAYDDLREYVEDLEDELMEMQADYDPDLMEESDCEEDDEEEEYEATTCPSCGKDFFYQPDAYDDDEDLLCPHCGEPFKQ